MISTTGAIRIEPGPLPVVTDIEEDDTDTPARPMPRREGPEGSEDAESARLVTPAPPAMPAGHEPPQAATTDTQAERPDPAQLTEEALRAELARREREVLDQVAAQIQAAVRDDPDLVDLARQLLIEQTPEGLRIQVLDAEREPMFALGGSAPNDRARALLTRVAQAIARLPNAVAIAGHTDATPFRGGAERSNWDLSAERANATRRLLTEAGLPESRIRSVTGHADREPLLPAAPGAAANRRVSITVLRGTAPRPDGGTR